MIVALVVVYFSGLIFTATVTAADPEDVWRVAISPLWPITVLCRGVWLVVRGGGVVVRHFHTVRATATLPRMYVHREVRK